MSWFKKNREELVLRENLELATEVKLLQGQLELSEKRREAEIAMWKERGDRLSVAHDHAKKDLHEVYGIIANILNNPGQLEAYKDVLNKVGKK